MNKVIKFLYLNLLLIGSASLAMNSNPADRGEQLCYAAKTGNLDLLTKMLDAGCSVETKMNGDATLLMLAAMNGHVPACLLLLDRKAQIDVKNEYGQTPLYFAALEGHKEICHQLLDHKADIQATDDWKRTPLIVAVGEGHKDVCQFLLDRKASVDAKNNMGHVPLIRAVLNGNKELCQLLINNNAQIDIIGGLNTTPLGYAAIWDHEEICRFLIDVQIKQNKAAAIALFGIRRFHKATCMIPIDPHVIKEITRRVFDTENQKLFAQIEAIPTETVKAKRIKDHLLPYAQQQLKMDQKTNNGGSHEQSH